MPELTGAPEGAEFSAPALLMLIGPSASGKSTWARARFLETEIVSSDTCRELVCDDASDQSVNREAFAVFYTLIRQRLRIGRLTVADSTALEPFARGRMLSIAREYQTPVHAVVFHPPLDALIRNNLNRDRTVPEHVIRRHWAQTEALLESGELRSEGYAAVTVARPDRGVPTTDPA